MEASWVCLKPQTKPKDCYYLLYSYMTMSTYICCEINSDSSSHKEGRRPKSNCALDVQTTM